MNCLLIDTSIYGFDIFTSSCNENTVYVPYNSTTLRTDFLTSFQTATQSLPMPVTRIAFVFHYSPMYVFLENEEIFTETNTQLLVDFIQTNSIERVDFLACNTLQDENWVLFYETLVNSTGVILGASNNDTGNIQYGGDWIMENTSEDIEAVYFTENIGYYTYLLGNPDTWSGIFTNNTVYFTGLKTYGQSGDGVTAVAQPFFKQIYNNTGKLIEDVMSGGIFFICLMTDKTLYGVGGNTSGQLGLGDTTNRTVLTQIPIPDGKTVQSLIPKNAGAWTGVIMTDGSIYACGTNSVGGLGIGVFSALPVTSLTLVSTLPAGKTISKIKGGNEYMVALMTDGSIYTTGRNTNGQLGLNDTTDRNSFTLIENMPSGTVSDIFLGATAWTALMTNGTMYSTGWNSQGELGVGDTTNRTILTQMVNNTGKTPLQVIRGSQFGLVWMEDNSIYGIGLNNSGQLGIGNTTPSQVTSINTAMTNIPGKSPYKIFCGNAFAVIWMTDNTFYSVGSNSNGQLGINNTTNQNSLVQISTVPTGKTWASFGCGTGSIYLITNNGVCYSCGNNASTNQLCNRIYTWGIPVNNTGKTISNIATGANHMIARMSDNTIFGAGLNTSGQLGQGNTNSPVTFFTQMTNSTSQTPSQIFCGNNHTIIRMANNSIYGTGLNTSGQLGNSSTTSVSSLVQMSIPVTRTPSQIACGGNHTIVLMTDNTIFGTGLNTSGQLGNNSTTSVSSLSSAQMTIPSGTPSQIACGDNHTIVLMTDNTIYGTGLNSSGQLGTGDTSSPKLVLTQMTIPVGKTPSQIFCGSNHTIVLMTDGTLYGTGLNTSGQLGINSTSSVSTLTAMTNLYGNKTPSQVFCGTNYTVVVMTDKSIYGTGANTNGELGTQDATNKTVLTPGIFENFSQNNTILFRQAFGYSF